MKKALALVLCLCLCAALFGCGDEELLCPGVFYYCRTDLRFFGTDGVIVPEQRELQGITEDLGAILELYCGGPLSRELENPLPQGIAVPQFTLSNGVLTLRFEADFAALSGVELTVAAACLAKTFLPLTGARTLRLTADGALLNGETALEVTLENFSLRSGSRKLL